MENPIEADMALAGILEDLHPVGDAMLTIAIAGTGFCFVKGALRSSSEGCCLAATGGVQAVVANLPHVCRWAAWSGVVLAIDVGMVRTRHVECPLNLALAWAAANVLFSVRRGTRAAVREGLKGAAYGGVASVAIYGILRFPDSVEISSHSS